MVEDSAGGDHETIDSEPTGLPFDFAGKIALVTGASSGIGRGIAEAFGQAGATVVVNYRNDADGAKETVRRVLATGGRARAVQADVADEAAVLAMFEGVERTEGRLDVLVNNAGSGGPETLLHETTLVDWNALVGANLTGAFLCAREAARRMIPRGRGRIVNITSVHEEACNVPGAGVYQVTKGGLRNLTRSLALELAPHGVTVNGVAPGMILTPMNRLALDDVRYRAEAAAQIPIGRAGLPADVAAMVLFLCSESAGYCTGQTHYVDGGWMLAWPPV